MKKLFVLLLTVACFYMHAQGPASKRDQEFVKCAAHAGMMEVRLGELAQTNALSPEVKKLGQMMIDDHTKANNELTALAQKKGIAVPTTLTDKEQKGYDKLAKMQGKDFDKAYTKCMVKDHKKVICKFKKEAKKGDDAELKTWASNTIPSLEHHKHMSEETCKAIKK